MKHLCEKPIQALVVACFDNGYHHQAAAALVEAIINRKPDEIHAAITEAITEIYDIECELKYGGPLADFCCDVRCVLILVQKTLVP